MPLIPQTMLMHKLVYPLLGSHLRLNSMLLGHLYIHVLIVKRNKVLELVALGKSTADSNFKE
eukprot:1161772-Pelagomonas_calceolata.AAC.14